MTAWLFSHRRYRLPFRQPLRTAHGRWAEREGLLLRAESSDGDVGWGEAAPVPGFGMESVDALERAISGLPEVPEGMPTLRQALAAATGPAPAAAGDEPLRVAALLPAGQPALGLAPGLAEAGFRTFKWKVGVGDWRDEVGILDDLCAALPAGSKLRLDANGAWDRRTAERWLERCAERPVEFVEQPSMEEDLLRGLAADFPTPVALDESLVGERDLEKWLGGGWPGFYVVKPSLLADPEAALARLAKARAQVVFSSAIETAVGARAVLRLAFSWPEPRLAAGFGVWPIFADARFDGPQSAPFIRRGDVERINPEEAWNALS